MIVSSAGTHAVGDRLVGIFDARNVYYPEQPCMVLAIVTFDEWLDELRRDLGHEPPRAIVAIAQRDGHFYRVSLD